MKEIFIITEAGKNIGFGHLTRCLALYQAFESKGTKPQLIVHADKSAEKILKGIRAQRLNWLKEEKQLLKIVADADVAVIDSYLADVEFYEKVRKTVTLGVYLDDYRRISYADGIVLNGTIGAENIFYPPRKGIQYWLGQEYILIRKEFWGAAKKTIRMIMKNILITFGSFDPQQSTYVVLKELNDRFPDVKKTVVIGKNFKNINKIKTLKTKYVSFVNNPTAGQMKRLMMDADLAISAAGQTLNELASVGVPTIAWAVVDNQRNNIKGWEKAGFIHVNNPQKIKKAVEYFLNDKERQQCSKHCRSFIQANSTVHTAGMIISYLEILRPVRVNIRKAQTKDCWDIWQWRNHPEARRWSFSQRKIGLNHHEQWFRKCLMDTDVVIYVAEDKTGHKIGQLRFNKNKDFSVISVNLNPQFYGKGYGARMIRKGTETFLSENPKVREIVAETFTEHIAAHKVFQHAGYVSTGHHEKNHRNIHTFKFRQEK
jgi:UDP-2,4-diacetamido-2,4,6-trideoxy-beta-L-altropyranose hydrolase